MAGYGGYPKIAEAMAFREALSWIKKRDAPNLLFELDSLIVVHAMRRRKLADQSYFGAVISDCLIMMKDLRSSNIYFVKRSANVADHTVAREASSMSDSEK